MQKIFRYLSFASVLFIFVPYVSMAAGRTERTYWDDAKLHPRNVQIFDAQGRQTGEWIVWFRDGQLRSKTSFLHGEVLLFEAWYPDGQKRTQQPLGEGMPNGLWIWWAPDGKILAKSYFNMGTGMEYYFDDDGKERTRVVWVSGARIPDNKAAK